MKRILYTGARSGIAINTINKIINEDYFLYLTVHTDKQLEYLEKHGIYPESVTCAGMASLLIEKLKNRQIEGLATPKQIRFLERYGFLHVGLWTFEAASKMITRISMNSWYLPRGIDPKSYQP